MLHQRFRDRRIDVIVRHVVADSIGAPSKGDLRQIAGADHRRIVEVGDPEEMRRPLAGLHVLERDVVHLLAPGEGMADVGQHLQAARTDVDLAGRRAHGRHESPGLIEGPIGSGEPGHRVRQDAGAGPLKHVHRPAAHDERQSRIEAARDADHELLGPHRGHALRQSVHLNIEDLATTVGAG